jgi:branched-chain amino acid transport system substrate-binding protein
MAFFRGLIVTVLFVAACAPAAPSPTAAPTKPPEAKPAEAPKPAAPTAPAAAPPAAEKGESYKIGAILDITGPASSLGAPERDTIKMLEEDLNARGGLRGPDGKLHSLQVVLLDNQSKEDQSVLAAKRLIEEEKTPVVIGASQSGTTLSMVDSFTAAQVPLISLAASIRIVEPVSDRKWIFKTPQSDVLIVTALVDSLQARGVKKAAWMSVNNAFGDSGRAEFEKLAPPAGIEIVANERFGAEDKDMSAQLTKVRGSGADVLIVWAIPPAAAVVTKNFSELGLRMPLYHSHGIGNRAFIELAGPAADGVIFPVGPLVVAVDAPDDLPPGPQKEVLVNYATEFKRKYNQDPSTFGGHAWDGFWIAVKAMEKAGNEPARIRDEIEKIKEFVGITGIFSFSEQDHNGLDKRAVIMATIKDGKWRLAN